MRRSVRLGVSVQLGTALLAALIACGAGRDGEDRAGGSASCAAVLVHEGHTYLGSGAVVRDPEVTRRSLPAVLPGCDDTGGQADVAEDEDVRVDQLAHVEPGTAVLFHGSVYVREGRDLPAWTRIWFQAPRCRTAGTFELTGDWVGVSGPRKVRLDGDIRLPYRLEVHVTSGPSRYVGTTIVVRATEATDPALTAADVRSSLWTGGKVSAAVQCAGPRFRARSLHT